MDARLPHRFSNISYYRGYREVSLYQPIPEIKPIEIKRKIQSKIGGLFGFGSSSFTAEVRLNRNEYLPGEQIEVYLKCDNSVCKYDVENIQFKLVQQHTYEDPNVTLR